MIAIDTNILARFYVDDPNDPESATQRPLAKQVLAESSSVFVPLTVILELGRAGSLCRLSPGSQQSAQADGPKRR